MTADVAAERLGLCVIQCEGGGAVEDSRHRVMKAATTTL